VNTVKSYLEGAAGVVRRDATIFLSYRFRLISQLFTVVFSLTLFYYLSRIVSVEAFPSPDAYFGFVVVGIAILGVLTSAFQTSAMSVRQELVAGTFERMVVSPFGALAGIVSLLIFPFLLALTLGTISILVAALIYGVEIQWGTAGLALPVAVLGALSFVPFGLAISAAALIFKQAAGLTAFLLAGITLVAGLYFPIALLPGWIQWASSVQPFTPAVGLLRNLLLGTPMEESSGLALSKLFAFAIVLLPISLWLVNKAVQTSRRHATIIEY
jgi:ABC-2 type transport system permease protein